MKIRSLTDVLGRVLLAFALLAPLASWAAAQRTFETPEAAVDALAAALKANDEPTLVAIFGDKFRHLVVTGDAANDAATRANFAAQFAQFHALEENGADRRVLLIGTLAWPVPIQLVREGTTWRFATEEGVDELLNRRIGKNELEAISVLFAYLDAQRQYASRDRNGDGVLEYAHNLASSPGKQDGLYWPADASRGEEESPFGPLIAESSAYLAGHKKGDPYRGYHYRILTAQGPGAPGGAYNYMINGHMVAGFAMVAYPAKYGETGIMSFIVSRDGKVYQKDLGKDSSAIGARISRFDPRGWSEVAP